MTVFTDFARKLNTSSLNAFNFFVPAVPTAFLVMKVGQVAKLKLNDHLIFNNCDSKDLVKGAVIFGACGSLYFYWLANQALIEIPAFVQTWRTKENFGHRFAVLLNRSASLSTIGLVAVAILKIENPRDKMLACGATMAVQAIINCVTPEEKMKPDSDDFASKLNKSSMNALNFFVPAVPTAFLVMKVGQVAKLKLNDRLIFDNCDSKDLLKGAAIVGACGSLYFYWLANQALIEKPAFVQTWKTNKNFGHRFALLLNRGASVLTVGLVAVAILKIENPRSQMLACGATMAVQAIINCVTPKEKKK